MMLILRLLDDAELLSYAGDSVTVCHAMISMPLHYFSFRCRRCFAMPLFFSATLPAPPLLPCHVDVFVASAVTPFTPYYASFRHADACRYF